MSNERENWDEGLVREDITSQPDTLSDLIAGAMAWVSTHKMSRRGVLAIGIGTMVGVLEERKFHLTELVVPDQSKLQAIKEFEQFYVETSNMLDNEAQVWDSEALAKFEDVAGCASSIGFPFFDANSDVTLYNMLIDYRISHQSESSLGIFQAMVKKIKVYRKGTALSLNDLLLAYANIPYRANPINSPTFTNDFPSRESIALQAVDIFMRSQGLGYTQFLANQLSESTYQNTFTTALHASQSFVGMIPGKNVRADTVRFLATTLGTAAGFN